MLKLLEIFGVRRAEVAGTTVQSVEAASRMVNPMLEVPLMKGRGGRSDSFRKIPVSRHDLRILMEYINVNRTTLIKKIRKRRSDFVDGGLLLISSTRGCGLLPNTVTQEISLLVRTAGLTQRVCAHMFRHRFITKHFVALIQQHTFENVESLRDALAATEDFKREVLEWTGHKSIQSLEPYLHLAFDELRGTKGTIDLARLQLILDSFCVNADQLQMEMDQGLTPAQQLKLARDLVVALKKDVSALSLAEDLSPPRMR